MQIHWNVDGKCQDDEIMPVTELDSRNGMAE
jgi:uncharacterized protein YqjF (DUF2071 family)